MSSGSFHLQVQCSSGFAAAQTLSCSSHIKHIQHQRVQAFQLIHRGHLNDMLLLQATHCGLHVTSRSLWQRLLQSSLLVLMKWMLISACMSSQSGHSQSGTRHICLKQTNFGCSSVALITWYVVQVWYSFCHVHLKQMHHKALPLSCQCAKDASHQTQQCCCSSLSTCHSICMLISETASFQLVYT